MPINETPLNAGWNFDNSYVRLPDSLYTRLNPTPVPFPQLVVINQPLADTLGLNTKALESAAGIAILAGNKLPEGASPLAQAYAGHQFGHFNLLGDGRALLLGEHISPSGKRFDIQLKGSGPTPYSRSGDGRAALGPMLREYVISEAMHALGIATTRSLAVVTTGESIIRETELPGAILSRVAASHLRVGTFQYVSQWGTVEELETLAHYAWHRHFAEAESHENRYLSLLREVIKRQAALIAQWQLVGFVHGVMNTDNMTISGETIDYGPCAFMDAYDPATVFSSIDTRGRYAYGNQPQIAAWNLARFAETLLPLLHTNESQAIEMAEEAISDFAEMYVHNWLKGMRAKLGIFNEEQQDESLIDNLLSGMRKYGADYTNTFRALTLGKYEDLIWFETAEFKQWHEQWQARLARQQQSTAASQQLMQNSNPAIIARNHQVEAALEAAVQDGDFTLMRKLMDALSNPYAYTPEQNEYATLPESTETPYRTFCGT
ncbi:protein adenylyltransferase SelO [Paenibacillus taiwanensis]|uniref:protein adenylyltransferase SelO n=1 Tax=Paenibacillus taiwanensis TaxID=401638 RepID=UPI000427A278|nr:YdiU family protein [Paenibacillus taiwanensis]